MLLKWQQTFYWLQIASCFMNKCVLNGCKLWLFTFWMKIEFLSFFVIILSEISFSSFLFILLFFCLFFIFVRSECDLKPLGDEKLTQGGSTNRFLSSPFKRSLDSWVRSFFIHEKNFWYVVLLANRSRTVRTTSPNEPALRRYETNKVWARKSKDL